VIEPTRLGASYLGGGQTEFVVWSPGREAVRLRILTPRPREIAMEGLPGGYYRALVDDASPGTRYMYLLDAQKERPDPASRSQPEGVHAASEVADPSAFRWTDEHWRGLALSRYVTYELHVGTFTPEGTFDAAIARLPVLAELGITAIEIMPVAQFPGARNWGYDGVYPFAAQNSYGGLEGLQRLVDACHRQGMAAVLDVVYNHLGPEGNYLWDYGPYFTDRYRTPWGEALNFDGPHSDEVRRFFIENALFWLEEVHFDALRLDAVHAIYDDSAVPFLQQLATMVHERADQASRRWYLIAESDLNDARLIRPPALGGYGLDAQWSDDLHHSVHALLTGERGGYYADFGTREQLATALRSSYVYQGTYSKYRTRTFGNRPDGTHSAQFVVCAQNHDQVGNRMVGDRLSQLVSIEKQQLAAGLVLLSPFLPLLFMGEEYGEQQPFQYFTNHSDPALIEAVRKGRTEEFAGFAWQGKVPDPDATETFEDSKLRWERRDGGHHHDLLKLHRELIALRSRLDLGQRRDRGDLEISVSRDGLVQLRTVHGLPGVEVAFNLSDASRQLVLPAGTWLKQIASSDALWGKRSHEDAPWSLEGDAPAVTLPAHSFVVYTDHGLLP
jgi:maltooligosyltrehalose trehalohydrolase